MGSGLPSWGAPMGTGRHHRCPGARTMLPGAAALRISLRTVLLEGRGWWVWQEAGAALGLGLRYASHMAPAPGGLITAPFAARMARSQELQSVTFLLDVTPPGAPSPWHFCRSFSGGFPHVCQPLVSAHKRN